MGYGLPAGIGAKLARPQDEVVVITGDGSIMMNIQELATARQYGIDAVAKYLLLDNSKDWDWSVSGKSTSMRRTIRGDRPVRQPGLREQVAEAFGVEASARISTRDEVGPGVARLLAAEGPCLAHVVIDPDHNVWPLVPPGKSNTEMMHRNTRGVEP